MKHSNLWLGLGIGLVIGVAVGAYYATSDERKAEIAEEINDKVSDAKKKIGKIVDQGLTELEKTTEKVSDVAQNTIARVKTHQI